MFVHDGVRAERCRLQIEAVVGEGLMDGLGLGVVVEEGEGAVAVREEVDAVAGPHGVEVVGIRARNFGDGAVREAGDPDARGLAAAVLLPHGEGAADGFICDGLAVGRHGGLVAGGQGELLFDAAFGRHGVEFGEAAVGVSRRGENDAFAVGGPAEDAVGRGMPGEALGDAAGGGDDEDVDVAIVLAGEGDLCAVGGEGGVGFFAGAVGEADGVAAIPGDAPEVARVGEDDVCLAQGGFLEEQWLVRGGREGYRGQNGEKEAHGDLSLNRVNSEYTEGLRRGNCLGKRQVGFNRVLFLGRQRGHFSILLRFALAGLKSATPVRPGQAQRPQALWTISGAKRVTELGLALWFAII